MDLAPLTAVYAQMPVAILVFARVAALFLAGPVLGEVYIPAYAKVLLSVALTAILYPLAAASLPAGLPVDTLFALLLVKESMVGLSLGFLISLYLHGVRFGGDLLNRHAGFSAAENFDPDTLATVSPLGDVVHMSAMLVFFASDGHHFFFAAMARSFAVLPVGGWQLTTGFGTALAQGMNDMSMIAMALSFPVLAVIMAITMAEGVITRAVPQINIMHISFAVKIVISLVVLYSGLPAAVAFIGTVLAGMQQVGYAALGVMG